MYVFHIILMSRSTSSASRVYEFELNILNPPGCETLNISGIFKHAKKKKLSNIYNS